MIHLMLLEMARNECPTEQYQRLGLPQPQRIRPGHDDAAIRLPSDTAIAAACLLGTEAGDQAAANGGNGWPKMPFGGTKTLAGSGEEAALFPDNLRLLPQYHFGPPEGSETN